MDKPFISLVIPAFNEEAIIETNLVTIINYINGLSDQYKWEILVINDGSTDKTGVLANQLAEKYTVLRIIHHDVNRNLGNSLKTGFQHAKGEYIVTFDMDLSYSVEHIKKLVEKIITDKADVVIASPYMKGGEVKSVPFLRRILSKFVNRYLYYVAQRKFHTFTGMVRAYNTKFIKSLNLKTVDYEVNPEVLYKALILRARIREIPACLDWSLQNQVGKSRVSSLRIIRGIFSGLMSGFIFRPYMFFFFAASFLFLIFLYILIWIFINVIDIYPTVVVAKGYFDDRFSLAVKEVYNNRSYAFLVGGFLLIVSMQFFSMGFISLQSKRYFEELFHINTTILRKHTDDSDN